MWSHCIVCASSLGENQDLEEFGVGRRLAFDAAKGRLWVVCPRCERWNLVPIEERWEAVEALERAFRGTPTRYCTAEIGLAQLRGGLEIVRIGNPVPGEFAAWRWGSRFGRRRRRLRTAAERPPREARLSRNAAWAAGLALAPLAPFLAPIGILVAPAYLLARLDERWPIGGGIKQRVGRHDLRSGGIAPSAVDPGWAIHLQLWEEVPGTSPARGVVRWREFTGEHAVRLARRAFPLLNRRTPKLTTIAEAVAEVTAHGGVERYLTHAAALKPRWVKFHYYPKPILLGMEMALFEAEERRAMEGEMERLVEAWREAEELAAISDSLIEPRGWEAFRAQTLASRKDPYS